jgi:hypothetical protein
MDPRSTARFLYAIVSLIALVLVVFAIYQLVR